MIKWKQEDEGLADYGLSYNNPDLVKYAESFGAVGHRITSTEHFAKILSESKNLKGVHVIDLPVDYSLNHEILNIRIKEYTDSLKKERS